MSKKRHNEMKFFSRTASLSIFAIIVGCGGDEDWKCMTENREIFSINSIGEISNASESCTCMQIRMFETATHGLVDEKKLEEEYGC